LEHIRDAESFPHIVQHDSDNKPILEPQLNVGGHGATQRKLKNYHVTMIGFCSGIGTGLFIGTGSAYANAGPAGLLLAYLVVGSVLWCVMQSIAELATVVGTLWRFVPHCTHHHSDPYCGFFSTFCEPLH
jgi:amino acid transporter